jgi:putative component of membrane protein insertase Oxa1/YidC/SpoIIIJ protein YidD
MKSLALGAIRFYQRFISPRKGFCCAYAAIKGHGSCSVLGCRAIRRYGVWRGIAVLDKRLEKCGIAYRRQKYRVAHGMLSRQAGFLDCACNAPAICDLPCGGLSGCEIPHCCSNLMCCSYLRWPYSGIVLALAADGSAPRESVW